MNIEISQETVEAMIARRKLAPLIPFEPIGAAFSPQSPNFQRKLNSVIKHGYRMNPNFRFKLDRDIPWNHENRTVAYNFQSYKPLSSLLAAYSMLKREDCLELATAFVTDWLSHVRAPTEEELRGEWKGDDSGNDFLWYDMAVGMRAYRLAFVVDAMMRAANPDTDIIARLLTALDWHRQILVRDETFSAHNNHGLYQACGQIILARRFTDLPGMDEALKQGIDRFDAMMKQQFFAEGVHREHSPGYHWMVLGSLGEAMRSGLLVRDEHVLFLQRIEDAMAWFIQPNMRIAAFGDSDMGALNETETQVSDFSHPHLRYVLSKGTMGLPPSQPLRMFEESGYAVFRANSGRNLEHACYLAQHSGFHSMTHKHADHMTMIWHDRDEDILVDAGRYAYLGKTVPGSELWSEGFWYADPKRVFVESTAAHNIVQIDGKNFPRRKEKPFGSALRRSASHNGVYAIESECRHFKSIRHARVLFINPGQFLIVFDWLKDNGNITHDYKQWFHLGPKLGLKRDGNFLWAEHEEAPFMAVCPLLSGMTLDQAVIGQEDPSIQGWTSVENGGALEPNWAFSYTTTPADHAYLATLFTLNPQAAVKAGRINIAGRSGEFSWHDGAGLHTLAFERPSAGDMSVHYTNTAVQM